MSLKIDDLRFTFSCAIGVLSNEQIFAFNDKGDFGMVIEQNCHKGITTYYSYGAHRIEWLNANVKVTPVDARLVIEGGLKQ